MINAKIKVILLFFVLLVILNACLEYMGKNNLYSIALRIISPIQIGHVIDELHGVKVYYNGPVSNVSGRNMTADGYNLGQKYQCVEFVKRYYYEALEHKMPDTYGHAKDFFDHRLADGSFNPARALMQYHNGGKSKPQVGDLLVFGGKNARYGHVAIVSAVFDDKIELIQQNPGYKNPSREIIEIELMTDETGQTGWRLKHNGLRGWLRKQ